MTQYLLDTNVISELRKRHKPAGIYRLFGQAPSLSLFASTLSIGEIRRGIVHRRRSDPAMADLLEQWANDFETKFAERILPVTMGAAKLWGEWSAERSRSVVDTLIAATAAANGMILVTRKTRDVQPSRSDPGSLAGLDPALVGLHCRLPA